jgi:hypothetical protein
VSKKKLHKLDIVLHCGFYDSVVDIRHTSIIYQIAVWPGIFFGILSCKTCGMS